VTAVKRDTSVAGVNSNGAVRKMTIVEEVVNSVLDSGIDVVKNELEPVPICKLYKLQ